MYVNFQGLDNFKCLLVNDGLEEARRILAHTLNEFRKEIKTPSTLKDPPRDDFATCLIPEDINRAKGQRLFALKTTPNGDCLFNAASILLCGNESVAMLLRLLVAGELFINAPFYADHDVFIETTKTSTDLTFDTLFSIALTKAGEEKFAETREKSEAVKAEVLVACTRGKWSSFIHVLGLASVVSKPLRSIYPDVNFRFRSLIHRSVSPRTSPSLDQPCGNVEPLNILWSRDGNFDHRPGVWFELNHFVPVISEEEVVQWPVKRANTSGTGCKTKQQGTLLSFMTTKPEASADNTELTKSPSVTTQKRNAVTAKLGKGAQPGSKKSTVSIVHKVQYKWKGEFPWLTVREEDQALLCSLCCNAPEVAGKSQFLTGCASTKKETMQKHAASNGHIRA